MKTVSIEDIQPMNPCKDRLGNYTEFYNNKIFTCRQFMGLKNITHADKLWVAFRLMDKDKVRLAAADMAELVLHVYESAYPNDDRPRKAIEAARNGDKDAASSVADAARDAAYAAAYCATYAASTADATYAAASSASYAACAAYTANATYAASTANAADAAACAASYAACAASTANAANADAVAACASSTANAADKPAMHKKQRTILLRYLK